MSGKASPRLWLLDRDGVLNEQLQNGYVLTWEQWRTLDGVHEALRMMHAAGGRVAVVTNQACVGKGLITEAEVGELHARFNAQLQRRGSGIDRFYVCPHRSEDGCACRKPEPGLILHALADFGVLPECAVLIGDSDSDVLAAARSGVHAVRAQGDGGLLRTVEELIGRRELA